MSIYSVPPTTLQIQRSILEYCMGAHVWELQTLLTNGIPYVNPLGQVEGSFQHAVAAAMLMNLPRIRVWMNP